LKKVFALYALLIIHFSLYPWSFAPVHAPLMGILHGWTAPVGRRDWFDVVANFLFYIPFGTLGALAWSKGRGVWRRSIALVAAGATLSLVLETLQAWVPHRDSSLRDVAMNSLGALAGVLIGTCLQRQGAGGARAGTRSLRQTLPLVLAAAWVAGQMFPFLPVLNRWSLQDALERISSLTPVSGLDLAEAFVSGLLLSFLLRTLLNPPLWKVSLATATVALLLAAFIQGVVFSWPIFLATVLAFWISASRIGRSRRHAVVLACLALLLIAVKEFYPFHLSPVPGPFHWMPFSVPVSSNQMLARVLSAKFFLYGTAIWTLRKSGLALWPSAGVVTLLLVAGEAVQRYLPGRTAESTDPLLAVLAAGLMVWLKDRSADR
jgi:VanZ family protein